MRYAVCLCLCLVIAAQAPSQPPPPFTVEIASPGVFAFIDNPVMVSGSAGILNGENAVRVELFNSEGTSVAVQMVNTNAAGQWLVNFGNRPDGVHIAVASVATGGSDATAFVVVAP